MARHRNDFQEIGTEGSERRQRRIPPVLPPPSQAATQSDIVLVATRLAKVEEQLTSYFASIAAQANAARVAAEAARADAHTEIEGIAAGLRRAIDDVAEANEQEKRALRLALDARLADVGSHQDWRITELESRLERVADEMTIGLDARVEAASEGLKVRLDQATSVFEARLSALHASLNDTDARAEEALRHTDELHAHLVARLDESTTSLMQRMDERSTAQSRRIEENTEALKSLVAETAAVAGRNLEQYGMKVDDRFEALEARVGEDIGTRVAQLDATIGRVSASLDEALTALSQRVAELTAEHLENVDRVAEIGVKIAKVDEEAIEALEQKMQSAIGEAVIMRIEMDRLTGGLDERFDQVRARISEIEAEVASNMDVTTAVQLERLEELERAVLMLSPGSIDRSIASRMDRDDAAPGAQGPAAPVAPAPAPVVSAAEPMVARVDTPTLPPPPPPAPVTPVLAEPGLAFGAL